MKCFPFLILNKLYLRMKILPSVIILIVIGCSPPHERIPDTEVIKTVEGFFEALDVENDNPDLINEYVTEDFILYEIGKKMNKQEFLEFIGGFPAIESDWELSDFRVSSDVNSAHISLFNKGRFIMQTDSSKLLQNYEWLESAYLVKVEDKLKIKFYFSDNIKFESEPID